MKTVNTKRCILLSVFLAWTLVSYAQNNLGFGVDPVSTKWKQIKTEQRRLIFPDYYENKARLVSNYFDTIAPYVAYNLISRIEKINVLLHPTNSISDGFVSWSPKKMELFTPPRQGYILQRG